MARQKIEFLESPALEMRVGKALWTGFRSAFHFRPVIARQGVDASWQIRVAILLDILYGCGYLFYSQID